MEFNGQGLVGYLASVSVVVAALEVHSSYLLRVGFPRDAATGYYTKAL